MFFDTHAHYDSKAFSKDREALLAGLPEKGVSLVLNPGCDLETSQIAVDLADKFPHVYAAVGIHPSDSGGLDLEKAMEKLEQLAKHPKVKALGEMGLDYYWKENPEPQEQEAVFQAQLDLAKKLDLPVIVHDREAHGHCMEIVERHPGRGVFHCYSGSVEYAKKLVDLGWMLSFTGVITYKNARKSLEVLEAIPLEFLMLETDAPYLTPEPHRKSRNDSSFLPLAAQVLAGVKGISLEEVAEITMENGKRFFGISE